MAARSLSTRKGSKAHDQSSLSPKVSKKILGGTIIFAVGVLSVLQFLISLSLINHDPPPQQSNGGSSSSIDAAPDEATQKSLDSNNSNSNLGATTRQCTPDQLAIVETQLPPADCLRHKNSPWSQRCSFSYATQCPDAMWVDELYKKRHREDRKSGGFTAIFVGCNKGMDAVDTLRMGSGNPVFDKAAWRNAMTRGGQISLDNSVCNQANLPQFELSFGDEDGATNDEQRRGKSTAQVHCIEPMPITAEALSTSARELQWDTQGFVVTHAAIAREDGITPFPSGKSVGKENKGIENCKHGADGVNCVNVDMYSLDTYVEKFLPREDESGGIIDFLSIDVEGFDMDVMLGGSSTLKNRVHYLEFEYNWMGSWKNQKLSDSIRLLDEEYDFTCYWPGYDGNIWRITDCWLDYYDLHFWANVAISTDELAEILDI